MKRLDHTDRTNEWSKGPFFDSSIAVYSEQLHLVMSHMVISLNYKNNTKPINFLIIKTIKVFHSECFGSD